MAVLRCVSSWGSHSSGMFSIWCERETRGQRTVRGSLTLDVPVCRWLPYICFRDTYKWHYLTHSIPLVRFTQHTSGDADNLEQHYSDVYSLGRHSSDVIRVGHHSSDVHY